MTSQEMYIRVTNDLQAIGAQRSRKYYPEQIELELNTETENLVDGAMLSSNRGFYSVDARYANAIQPLTKTVKLAVYTDGEQEFYSEPPTDCRYILEVSAVPGSLCRGLLSTDYTIVTGKKQMNASTVKSIPTRRVGTDLTLAIPTTAFYKANHVEIPVALLTNKIQLITGENCIVNHTFLTYVRNPVKINLLLSTGSDLAPSCHGLICDRAVQRIRERIGDPKFQSGIIQESKL